jgi:HU domain fused to wHTH, Ig, or Glycine-rich motif
MKLRELNEAIAQTCDVRANVVSAVLAEAFRQMRVALDKGDKIVIPEFGMFLSRESTGEDGTVTRVVRFREKTGDRGEKKKAKAAATPGSDEGEEGGE